MSLTNPASRGESTTSSPAQHLLQAALVALLVVWCFHVVRPFVVPVAWAVIIAVTLNPVYVRLEAALHRRRVLAAVITTMAAMVLLAIPVAYLGDTLIVTAERLGTRLSGDGIHIPPPPDAVGGLPVVGEALERRWLAASKDTGAVRDALERALEPAGTWLLSAAAGVTVAVAQFVVAILIAGLVLARSEEVIAFARRVMMRVAPREAHNLVVHARETIRNVSRGVLGVAFIQALAAGIGFLLVGLPAAGLWALLCFVLAVVQIGTLPIVGPAALYVLFNADLIVAVPFAAWCAFVGVIDNFLKPLLLHHGLDVPLWLIVVGSIGGLVTSGVIGLFIGPVVLVLAYELARVWLGDDETGEGSTSQAPRPGP